jgi:hypothetical protein
MSDQTKDKVQADRGQKDDVRQAPESGEPKASGRQPGRPEESGSNRPSDRRDDASRNREEA